MAHLEAAAGGVYEAPKIESVTPVTALLTWGSKDWGRKKRKHGGGGTPGGTHS